MSRALVLGNGQILVNLDERAQVRDFYFPHVGLENQLGGRYVHRVGAFVDGELAWTSDAGWQLEVNYEPETFVSKITAVHARLAISLIFTDVVYNEKNIFVRKVVVKNLSNQAREIKIFFAHQFELYESHMAHTAYFDPANHALIHYRNQRAFLINAKLEGNDFDDYSTGVFGSEGKEGTHVDALDGQLSQNPIEHGRADSALGLTDSYQAGEEKILYYWLTVGHSITEVIALNNYVIENGAGHLVATTRDFWKAWVTRQAWTFHGLDASIVQLFQCSLFIIRAHADSAGGIIASSDSQILQHGKDTYNYVWPRDAAVSAIALARAGDLTVARRFFAFCHDVLGEGEYFMHKYSPDKSLGSSWHPWLRAGKPELPIQEDETALVLIGLWQYYQVSKDIEFIEEIYNSLIKKTADFMATYRDEKTGLPKGSYNLWEEQFGVSTFTASAVAGALRVASHFAELLGKVKSARIYDKTASEIQTAIMRELYDDKRGCFYQHLASAGQDTSAKKSEIIDASSFYGPMIFGILPIGDEKLARAFQVTQTALTCKTATGGVARYQDDKYYKTSNLATGNPWFVTTLWLAQYQIKLAKSEADLQVVKETLDWVVRHASPAGLLAEQLDPATGQALSVSPLVWSHAEFVSTVIHYLDKLEELGVCKACNPVY
ncbi:MAG: glycoside hydrolase family 15 protein [Patescibacteria group bacterium]